MRNPLRRRPPPRQPAVPVRPLTNLERPRLAEVLNVMSDAGMVDASSVDQNELASAIVGELGEVDDPSSGDSIGFDQVLGALIIVGGDRRQPTPNLATTDLWNEICDQDVVEMARRICLLHRVDPPLTLDRDAAEPTSATLKIGLEPPALVRVVTPRKGVPEGVAEGIAPLLAARIAPAQLMEHVGSMFVHSVLTPEQTDAVNKRCGATFAPVVHH